MPNIKNIIESMTKEYLGNPDSGPTLLNLLKVLTEEFRDKLQEMPQEEKKQLFETLLYAMYNNYLEITPDLLSPGLTGVSKLDLLKNSTLDDNKSTVKNNINFLLSEAQNPEVLEFLTSYIEKNRNKLSHGLCLRLFQEAVK